ncbi:hypothetical protein [Facklamia sp. P12955]
MKLPTINFEEVNFFTILLRPLLAMLINGMIGFGRGLKIIQPVCVLIF